MKRLFISVGLAMSLLGQNQQGKKDDQQGGTFQIVSSDAGSGEIDVPEGTTIEEDEDHKFVSEDGQVEFRVPRTDLVKPVVQSSYANGVYTYVITNARDAKRAIACIKIETPIKKLTQVQGDPRMGFTGLGWVLEDAGLKPGETMVVSVRADGSQPGKVRMKFVNAPGDYTLPNNTPYGLQVLLGKHLGAGHDHVGVEVTGPK